MNILMIFELNGCSDARTLFLTLLLLRAGVHHSVDGLLPCVYRHLAASAQLWNCGCQSQLSLAAGRMLLFLPCFHSLQRQCNSVNRETWSHFFSVLTNTRNSVCCHHPSQPTSLPSNFMAKKVTPKTRLRDIQRLLDKNTKLPPDVRSKFEAEAKTIEQQLQQVSASISFSGNNAL